MQGQIPHLVLCPFFCHRLNHATAHMQNTRLVAQVWDSEGVVANVLIASHPDFAGKPVEVCAQLIHPSVQYL